MEDPAVTAPPRTATAAPATATATVSQVRLLLEKQSWNNRSVCKLTASQNDEKKNHYVSCRIREEYRKQPTASWTHN